MKKPKTDVLKCHPNLWALPLPTEAGEQSEPWQHPSMQGVSAALTMLLSTQSSSAPMGGLLGSLPGQTRGAGRALGGEPWFCSSGHCFVS